MPGARGSPGQGVLLRARKHGAVMVNASVPCRLDEPGEVAFDGAQDVGVRESSSIAEDRPQGLAACTTSTASERERHGNSRVIFTPKRDVDAVKDTTNGLAGNSSHRRGDVVDAVTST